MIKTSAMKKLALLIFMLLCILPLYACAAQTCVLIEEDALTDEAKLAFAALTGEQGVTLYGDLSQMTQSDVRMYAVLYGSSGQELTLSHFWKTLTMRISGAAQEGYTVWRVTYNPMWVERAAFDVDGKEYRMDAYKELDFAVEEALRETE